MTWTWYWFGGWKADARFAARTLGAPADRNPALLFCVTLDSDGSALGMANSSAIDATSTYHRNRTPHLPIPANLSATTACSPRAYRGFRDGSTVPAAAARRIGPWTALVAATSGPETG